MDKPPVKHAVILGVDTHLDVHVGVIINGQGNMLGVLSVETNVNGYRKLLKWARSFGDVSRAGIEGTGTYGLAWHVFYPRGNCNIRD